MGSGKSHWGKRLAQLLHWQFIDLDTFIEQQEGTRIARLFEQHGEAHFRALEKKYLEKIATLNEAVIAAGGGTPCFYDNMQLMNRTGETYYMKAKIETIMTRVIKGKSKRPLLKGKTPAELPAFFEGQLKVREPFYLQARHVVEVEKLEGGDLKEIFGTG